MDKSDLLKQVKKSEKYKNNYDTVNFYENIVCILFSYAIPRDAIQRVTNLNLFEFLLKLIKLLHIQFLCPTYRK